SAAEPCCPPDSPAHSSPGGSGSPLVAPPQRRASGLGPLGPTDGGGLHTPGHALESRSYFHAFPAELAPAGLAPARARGRARAPSLLSPAPQRRPAPHARRLPAAVPHLRTAAHPGPAPDRHARRPAAPRSGADTSPGRGHPRGAHAHPPPH